MSGFEFTASQPEFTMSLLEEPPDRGGGGSVKSAMSFRDKVLGIKNLPLREKVDLVAHKLVDIELVNGNRLLPMMRVEKKVIEELSLPWKDALIVKRLGKPLGFNVMKSKLTAIWKLIGGFEMLDVGNGYFMVKFEMADDRDKVINGGPWMIFDHYLSVRTWSSDFNASTATIDKTMVWVRIPSLNLLFYDESFLLALASMVGQPVKVDTHTLKIARGRFARVCVEIDLNQPVVGRVGIDGRWYNVEYEGLHIICAHCGCYGHLLKDCPNKPPMVTTEEGTSGVQQQPVGESEKISENPNLVAQYQGDSNHDKIEEVMHGEWLVVARKKRNNKYAGGEKNKDVANPNILNKYVALFREEREVEDLLNKSVRPTKSLAVENQRKEWSKKKRPRRDANTPSSGPSSSITHESNANVGRSSSLAVGSHGKNNSQRMQSYVNGAEHLILKDKVEPLVEKFKPTPQVIHEDKEPSNKASNEATGQPSSKVPPDPGESNNGRPPPGDTAQASGVLKPIDRNESNSPNGDGMEVEGVGVMQMDGT